MYNSRIYELLARKNRREPSQTHRDGVSWVLSSEKSELGSHCHQVFGKEEYLTSYIWKKTRMLHVGNRSLISGIM